MLPKFGLFDFLECKSVDVALMSDIKWADSGPPKDVNDVIQSGRVVTVQWRKKGGAARCKGKKMPKVQEFQAKLLKVHDDSTVLRQLANDIEAGKLQVSELLQLDIDTTGRGLRRKFKPGASNSSDSETEAPVDDKASKRKTASALKRKQSGEILAKIKEQQALDTADSDTSCDTDEEPLAMKRSVNKDPSDAELAKMETAYRKKNRELRCELAQMRSAITALQYLPDVVTYLKSVFPQTSQTATSSIRLPSSHAAAAFSTLVSPKRAQLPSSNASSSSSVLLSPQPKCSSEYQRPSLPSVTVPADDGENADHSDSRSEHVLVSDVALSRCNRMVPQKFVNDLLTATYTEEYMACHSLGGKSSKESSKAALPPADVQQIIEKVIAVFPVETTSHIRGYIRSKLNNADKGCTRKAMKIAKPQE